MEFERTRRSPWPGWAQLRAYLPEPPSGRPFRVLDIGCGSGRFRTFLERCGVHSAYVGLDESLSLLTTARGVVDPLSRDRVHLIATALRPEWRMLEPYRARFDLVAIFGLLHHVPRHAYRAALLQRCLEALDEGGLLAATFWQFENEPSLAQRRVPWAEAFERGLVGSSEPLEPGDHLLTFGGDRASLRYCHSFSEPEIDRLLQALPASEQARYSSDGASKSSNRYVLWRRARQ